MNKSIKADLYRYGGLSGRRGFRKGLKYPGFRYMYAVRKMKDASKYSLSWFFFRLRIKRYSFKFGYQIPYTTEIGDGFYIGHFGTIVINRSAVIGKNCNIAHGVTIGRTNRGETKGSPIIGDYVWIGTGAVIVGGIRIGSNVLIAPNAYVNVDVPEHSLVIGNPCRIVEKANPCEGYINNTLDS